MLRVFQWHFYSQEEHTLHFLCGSGPDLDAPCPYVCSKTQPVMLPVSHFTLLSSVASSTPKNNHHQCHMVSKIKGPRSEYISSWLYFKCFKYVPPDGKHGALTRWTTCAWAGMWSVQDSEKGTALICVFAFPSGPHLHVPHWTGGGFCRQSQVDGLCQQR